MAGRSRVNGARSVSAALRQMRKQYGVPVDQASRAGLQVIRRAAKRNIADDPELASSLVIRKDRKQPRATPTHELGPLSTSPAAFRAHFKEFGTDPHPIRGGMHPGEQPQPFLTSAFMVHGKEAVDRFGERLGPAIERQAAKLAKRGR